MNITCKLSVFAIILLFFTSSIKAVAEEKTSETCEFLPENLYSCNKFKCQTILKEGENNNIINQEIKGLDDNQLCIHEQLTVNNELIICRYEKESRKFMSIKMQDAKNGIIGKNSEDIEYSEALIGEIFSNECEVFDKDGNKINFLEKNKDEEIDFKTFGKVEPKE